MYNFDLGIFLLIVCSNCKLALLFNLTPLSSTISSNFDFVAYNILYFESLVGCLCFRTLIRCFTHTWIWYASTNLLPSLTCRKFVTQMACTWSLLFDIVYSQVGFCQANSSTSTSNSYSFIHNLQVRQASSIIQSMVKLLIEKLLAFSRKKVTNGSI